MTDLQRELPIAPPARYSESFTPLVGSNFTNRRFEPLRGEQTEVGVKWEPPGSRLAMNVAAYTLKEQNRLVPDPDNPLNQLQAGSTRNRGVELELIGRLLPGLDIAAHYNYVDLDAQLEGLPKHQAAVWGTYRFALAGQPGYRGGVGVRYMGSFGDADAPATPSSTLVDAMLGFDAGRWRVAANVQNLTDKTYVSTCLARGDCFYGARRTVVLTASYRF